MTSILVPAPPIEADVSAEQVTAYLLARGWMPAPAQNPYWQGWHKGERVLTIPQTDCDALRTWLSENMALSIADIARAEGRHPSAVLADIVGPAAGVAGRACQDGPDIERVKCRIRMASARNVAERAKWEASRVYVETDDSDGATAKGGEGA